MFISKSQLEDYRGSFICSDVFWECWVENSFFDCIINFAELTWYFWNITLLNLHENFIGLEGKDERFGNIGMKSYYDIELHCWAYRKKNIFVFKSSFDYLLQEEIFFHLESAISSLALWYSSFIVSPRYSQRLWMAILLINSTWNDCFSILHLILSHIYTEGIFWGIFDTKFN